MAFWFSLVLLVLPFGSDDGTPGVNPIQAFFAAKEAVDDVAGICERKPEVCEVGRAAVQTIGARAKESARMAYEMLDDGNDAPTADSIGALIAEDAHTASIPAKVGAAAGSAAVP
jgi:hypothetical protein